MADCVFCSATFEKSGVKKSQKSGVKKWRENKSQKFRTIFDATFFKSGKAVKNEKKVNTLTRHLLRWPTFLF